MADNRKPNQNKGGGSKPPAAPNQNTGVTQTPARPKPPLVSPTLPTGERKLTPKQVAARRRQAIRRRNQAIAIGLIALVTIAAIVLIVIAVNQPVKFDTLPAKTTSDNTIALNEGLTQTDERYTKGATTANVIVTEFADFQCPACRQFFESEEKQLNDEYIKPGKIKYVFNSYAFLDQGSTAQESHLAAEAAYCAADQKRFWDFHDALYMNQLPENTGKLTSDRMKQLADQLGLNKDSFSSCLDTHKYRTAVADERSKGEKLGVNSTPSIAVNGKLVVSATPNSRPNYNEIKDAIEKALAAAPKQ